MFSWFGHQSRFVLVVCMIGHLPALSSVFASIFLSERAPGFSPVPYTRIICCWKVIHPHGQEQELLRRNVWSPDSANLELQRNRRCKDLVGKGVRSSRPPIDARLYATEQGISKGVSG